MRCIRGLTLWDERGHIAVHAWKLFGASDSAKLRRFISALFDPDGRLSL